MIARIFLFLVLLITFWNGLAKEEEQKEIDGVRFATKCETCKYVVDELEQRLSETGKSEDSLHIGSATLDDYDDRTRVKKYRQSELRFIETLEGLCERILDYNVHKQHKDSKRFAKGMSETMQTLHGLVDKGVSVDLGIPHELWDSPSVEITRMKLECEQLLEDYEEDLENWFHKCYVEEEGNEDLLTFLCVDRALKGRDMTCLKAEKDKVLTDKSEL